MSETISLDGRTLAAANDAGGEVHTSTRFEFSQNGERFWARYAGGIHRRRFPGRTLDGDRWDVRYVQLNADGETATGHSLGDVILLADGRVRVEDE